MAAKRAARKKIELTDEQIEQAKTLAGLGLRNAEIAEFLGVSEKTMRRRAQAALTQGRLSANAKVAQTAFKMATSGKHPIMTIFWLKVRNRWSDSLPPPDVVDVTPQITWRVTQPGERIAKSPESSEGEDDLG